MIVNVDLKQTTDLAVDDDGDHVAVSVDMGASYTPISLMMFFGAESTCFPLSAKLARIIAVQLLQAAELAERTGLQAEDA